jgi:hypothetical protein
MVDMRIVGEVDMYEARQKSLAAPEVELQRT